MPSRKRSPLVAEIGRLLVEYPAKDWNAVLDRLRDRELVENIAKAIDEALEVVAESTEKTKKQQTRPSVSVLATVAQEDPRKAEILSALKSRLTDKDQGVTLEYIRRFANSLGMKEELASHRGQAINQLIRYLATKETKSIEATLHTALPLREHRGQEYDRWVALIVGEHVNVTPTPDDETS